MRLLNTRMGPLSPCAFLTHGAARAPRTFGLAVVHWNALTGGRATHATALFIS